MNAAHDPIGAIPARQEWNLRWLAILVATALLAGGAGYVAGGSRSGIAILTGDAQSGIAQTSVQTPDGVYYAIPWDVIFWVDAKGAMHSSGRPDCLPQPGVKSAVEFGAVQWAHEGVTQRSVVWVNCRS
jgi:hypothetical protein